MIKKSGNKEKGSFHYLTFPKSTRGQGLSTNAIILIVLGIIVLTILVAGFAIGWDKVAPWLSEENVDSVVKGCETACTTRSIFGYCAKNRMLHDGEKKIGEDTCFNFAKEENKDKYGLYGIKPCLGLCADEVQTQQTTEISSEELE